ncbi:MAG: helix-turn-helix domain-containing protein [Chitinophagaceae bacterium]
MHYADGVAEIQKQALVFSNPQIPYSCEYTDRIVGGYFCLFTPAFFHQYGNLDQYAIFQPGNKHAFELTDEQVTRVTEVYKSMFEEIESDYMHKYDVLRNLFFELLHIALKLPAAKFEKLPMNASQRISSMFLELLERQFPIDENHQSLNFRSASDYAKQLNVHVNHLNRAVKENTDKTTSQIIAERILRESKILLKHSAWNVSEIAWALGFNETTHFNNFFKKHVQLSPLKFRNI